MTFFLWCQLDSPFWILVGMSIRPSQPQREENPFSGFLLHLAPCLASSRSSILGVWGHQPNKPLWIQKVCQCRQEQACRGLGEAGSEPRVWHRQLLWLWSVLDLWGQPLAWLQDPGWTMSWSHRACCQPDLPTHGRRMGRVSLSGSSLYLSICLASVCKVPT